MRVLVVHPESADMAHAVLVDHGIEVDCGYRSSDAFELLIPPNQLDEAQRLVAEVVGDS